MWSTPSSSLPSSPSSPSSPSPPSSPRRISIPIAAALLAGGAALFALVYACVPADTRPPPAVVTVTVSPSPAVADGVTTVDGWTIKFDRVLLNIGGASLQDDCTSYSDANYSRVLDVTHQGGQKLSLLHGIGTCDFRFRITSPSSDSLLGAGVTEEDKTAMRLPGSDPYAPLGGIAADIALTATRGDITKRFHLLFRSSVRYQRCSLTPDSGPAMNLVSDANETLDIRIEAESLLRDDPDAAGAVLRFNPFADADTNGDGIVTLDELRAVPLEKVRDGGAFEAGTYDVDDAGAFVQGKPIAIDTLGDFVYILLAPLMPRFRDTGMCAARRDRRGGGGGGGGPPGD